MKVRRGIVSIVAFILLMQNMMFESQAETFYASDGQEYEEGYIFVGESHVAMMSGVATILTDSEEEISGLEHINYNLEWDSSVAVTADGKPNTFKMKGNLFFVFEGINNGIDGPKQANANYLYSNGKGNYGKGVGKIHQIMETCPNIKHWTIITFAGGSVAKKGVDGAQLHINSYRNWINYEFPNADFYIMSQSTLTKYYRTLKDPEAYNRTLAAAFPEHFLDYTDYFRENYPSGMRDPKLLSDTVHWSEQIYFELLQDVIITADTRRHNMQSKISTKNPVEPQISEDVQKVIVEDTTNYEIEEVMMVLTTNEYTQFYEKPFLSSALISDFRKGGYQIQVIGITSTGFYQVQVGDGILYVPAHGLSSRQSTE